MTEKQQIETLNRQLDELRKENAARGAENKILRSSLGEKFDVTAGKLPPEVQADYQRRVDAGLPEADALQCALRQYQHDQKQVKAVA